MLRRRRKKLTEKNVDRRVRVTKMILRDSLIELMKEKPLHEISIKAICEKADINRSTFYHHYGSQYDLFDDIVKEISGNIWKIINISRLKKDKFIKMLTEILTYCENNRELFIVLLGANGNFNIGETLAKEINRFLDRESKDEIYAYCTQFFSAGITSVLWTWLNKSERESARDIAMMLNAIIMYGIKRAMVLSGNM